MTEQVETIAVLFADISGSTQIIKEHGDLAASGIIQRCLDRAAKAVTRHRGRVVGQFGDELLCAIPDLREAVVASLDIREEVRAGGQAGEYPTLLRMHIGLHYGPVVEEEGQLFGDTVNKAKRMVNLAKADQVLVTRETLNAVGILPGVVRRFVDQVRIEAYDSPVEIFEIMRDDADATTRTDEPIEYLTGECYVRCRLDYGGSTYILDESKPVFTIGRDGTCNLSILRGCVSRDHGRLEYQKGRIIYVDQSTNGTFVMEESARNPVLVHREQRWLRNRGLLRFGNRKDITQELSLGYRCETE